MVRIVRLLILLAAVGLTSPCCYSQGVPSDQLCGVHLRPSVQQLRLYVENKLGTQVACKLGRILVSEGDYAHFDFDRDVPTITLDENYGKDETEITHELFHVKQTVLRLTGQQLKVSFPAELDDGEFFLVLKRFKQALEHRQFYPAMTAMGFDPTKKDRGKLEELLNSTQGINRRLERKEFVTKYVAYATQRLPPPLLAKLDRVYRDNGLERELTYGKKIASVIQRAKSVDSTQMNATIRKCLELYYDRDLPSDIVVILPGTFLSSAQAN